MPGRSRPLNVLRAVEAAARHVSIPLTAISHQIEARLRNLNVGFNRAWSKRLDCWTADDVTRQPSDSEDSAAGEFMLRHLINQPRLSQLITTRKRRSAGSL